MSYAYRILIAIVIMFACNLSLHAENLSFQKIVFFGDSLSDNGNLSQTFEGAIPKSPPYFAGRFTNGYTWADRVENYFKTNHAVESTNLAFGGATVMWKYFWTTNLTSTVNRYSNNTATQEIAKSLLIVWIGSNDYLENEDSEDNASTEVVKYIKRNVEQLINKGAQNILVINLPNLSISPKVIDGGSEKYIKNVVELHNVKLDIAIKELQQKHANLRIRLFDAYGVFGKIVDYPEYYNQKFGTNITNLRDSCWPGSYYSARSTADKSVDEHTFNVDVGEAYRVSAQHLRGEMACPNPENYLFWDSLHPTTVVHSIISQVIIEYIQQNYMIAQKR